MHKRMVSRLKRWHLRGKQMEFERKLSFHNFKTARNCLIFWVEGDVSFEVVEKLSKLLSEHMEVSGLVFVDKAGSEYTMEMVYANEDSISYAGKFLDNKLKACVENAYDLWIDLSLKPDALTDYIVRNSRAKCKIGMGRKSFENDIVFEDVKDIDTFTKRIAELLSKVNKY